MTNWFASFVQAAVYTCIFIILVDGVNSAKSLEHMTYVLVSIASTVYLLNFLPDRIGEAYGDLYVRVKEVLR